MFNYNYNPYIKFSNIDSEVYKLILANGIKENHLADKFVVKPYECLEYIHFIDRGLLKLTTSDLDGKEQILALFSTGACILGTLTIYEQISDEFYCKTILNTDIYKIPIDIFTNLYDSSKVFRHYIIKNENAFVLAIMRLVSTKSLFSNKQNLYDFLVYSINKDSVHDSVWYKLDYNFTQDQLGNILGISISSITRAISNLCDEGKVRIVKKKIEVNIPEETFKQYYK